MSTERDSALRYVAGAIVCGIAFVSLQGVEWVALLREGLTMTSSTHGAFFYLIVGAHALHAVAAIIALTWVYVLMRAREIRGIHLYGHADFLVFCRGLVARDLFAGVSVRIPNDRRCRRVFLDPRRGMVLPRMHGGRS